MCESFTKLADKVADERAEQTTRSSGLMSAAFFVQIFQPINTVIAKRKIADL